MSPRITPSSLILLLLLPLSLLAQCTRLSSSSTSTSYSPPAYSAVSAPMKMGIKFLSSQMLNGCFYTDTSNGAARNIIRLIRSDGRVKTYDRPVLASELMAEFPKHMVCHSDSFCIGRKVPALSGADRLQPGHSYFLLPSQFFQSVLSFVSIASSFAEAAAAAGGKGGAANRAALLKTFDVHRTPAGELKIRVSDEFVEKIRGAEEEEEGEARRASSRVCTTEALEKDYKALVRCKSQQWKPKLETIKEYDRKKSFGRIRRKNQEPQEQHQQQKSLVLPPPSLSPPPPPPPLPSPLSSSLKKSRWKGKIVSVK